MTNVSNGKRTLGVDVPYLLSEWKDMFKLPTIPADLWAGTTVALVALPLNLALAIAAGVEPGVGIITAIVASIVASMLGGQRYAITGPAAAMAVVLVEIAQTHGIAAIWLVGLMAGILQILAGALRFGKLMAYIPMPVIVGFSNAIGILIIFNALENFLGLPVKAVARAGAAAPLAGHPLIPEFIQDIISLVWHVIVHQDWNVYAIATGCIVVFIAAITPRFTKAIPAQLVAIVVASLVAVFCEFQIPRIVDVSAIPRSLPFPQFPGVDWEDLGTLFPSIITVFLLASIESLLSASVADGMTMSKKHHSDQELIGQGIANVITPFFGGIPVTGVIARTAVNIRSGARTRLSSIVHAVILMILSFSFAKQAEQIPLAALAGILVLTGVRLIEWDATKQIWLASRTEGMVVLATTIASVLIDLTAGVVVGLLLTCGLFIRRISDIRIVPHEYDPDRRAAVRQPIPACKYVRTFLVDGPLFFGAAERFAEVILQTQNLKVVILHMKSVDLMDLTGVETLLSIKAQLSRNGVKLVLAELPRQPLELMRTMGALDKIGQENVFDSFREAMFTVNQHLLETTCTGCAAALNPEDKSRQGPSDCKLKNALALNSDQIGNIMSGRMKGSENQDLVSSTELKAKDDQRLIAINSLSDIPPQFDGTPIEALLRSQNFYEVSDDTEQSANLIIGMCTDYRKQLHLPKDCAYVVRSPGANMKGQEFSIALALSYGIEYMALLVHNHCIMSNPVERRRKFVRILAREHKWNIFEARRAFDRSVHELRIGDPVKFALEESVRLERLFAHLTVVPLLYDVDTDRIFLIAGKQSANVVVPVPHEFVEHRP